MPAAVTWLVRFVEGGEFRVRTFSDREVAELFMRSAIERGVDIRSWAEVRTTERPLPPEIVAARKPA